VVDGVVGQPASARIDALPRRSGPAADWGVESEARPNSASTAWRAAPPEPPLLYGRHGLCGTRSPRGKSWGRRSPPQGDPGPELRVNTPGGCHLGCVAQPTDPTWQQEWFRGGVPRPVWTSPHRWAPKAARTAAAPRGRHRPGADGPPGAGSTGIPGGRQWICRWHGGTWARRRLAPRRSAVPVPPAPGARVITRHRSRVSRVGLDRLVGLVGNPAGWRMKVRTSAHGSGQPGQGSPACAGGGAGRVAAPVRWPDANRWRRCGNGSENGWDAGRVTTQHPGAGRLGAGLVENAVG